MPNKNISSDLNSELINLRMERMTQLAAICETILQNQIRDLKKSHPPFIPGHLVKTTYDGHVHWKQVLNPEESGTGKKEIHYLNKSEKDALNQLAAQLYYQCSLSVKERQLTAIRRYLQTVAKVGKDNIRILNDPDLRNLLGLTAQMPEALSSWQHSDYPRNPQHPEGLRVHADGNLMVRSKSEAIIVSELTRFQIPFRYEAALTLRNTLIYPDFTIRHPVSGQAFIWEHLGMMDDQNYAMRAARKIEAYIQTGYIPMLNLILTSETKARPLDYQTVRLLIHNYFILS